MVYGVSFVIPAYNEENLIRNCIEYIKNEIKNNTTYGLNLRTEIIVVDNNCTDNTADIARDSGAIVISCIPKGITHARQAGYHIAKYDIQAYIDADNQLPIGWLDNLIILDDPRVIGISGPLHYIGQSKFVDIGSRIFYWFSQIAHSTIGPMLQGGNFVLKKWALDSIGGHCTDVQFWGEDTLLSKRLSKVGTVVLVPNMWIYSSARRLEGQGIVSTTFQYIINYLWVSLFNKPITTRYVDIRPDSNVKS